MPGFGGELREDKVGTQRRRGTRNGETPHETTGIWDQDEGGKRGITTTWETAEDTSTRRILLTIIT